MDLKGSLIDTHLKIYPSVKFIDFIRSIPKADNLPHNILQIVKGEKGGFLSYSIVDQKPIILTTSDVENIKKIEQLCFKSDTNSSTSNKNSPKKDEPQNIPTMSDKETSKEDSKEKNDEDSEEEAFLVTADLDWLYNYLNGKRCKGEKDIPYLHSFLTDSRIEVPKNEMLKRNPVLEARCVKLRAQQEAREYRKMTKGVDNVRMRFPEDSISYQMKQLNRQLIAIGQFIISIFAGFLFGFRGVEWMVGNLDFGFRLLLGVMCALIIALAEIYFLAKKLNEELCVPETVQLGGPIKFADDSKNVLEKQHQD